MFLLVGCQKRGIVLYLNVEIADGRASNFSLRRYWPNPIGYCLHRGGKKPYRKPTDLLTTDHTASAASLMQAYLDCMQIEVGIRRKARFRTVHPLCTTSFYTKQKTRLKS